jgi:hypothetical protein
MAGGPFQKKTTSNLKKLPSEQKTTTRIPHHHHQHLDFNPFSHPDRIRD